ncbi:MAG: flgH [Phycisphaerales bacterium]|nr:flgH [Phycisphaerales bacterium]
MKAVMTNWTGVVLLCLSSVAAAQSDSRVSRLPATATTNVPSGPPPSISQLMRSNGGSLRRAAMQMPDDPRTAKPADMNYFAVAEQKPKTLLKHDLVTIVISEQSEFKSDGTTDTKKDNALDAKIDAIPSLAKFTSAGLLNGFTPELKLSGNRSFKGDGSVDRKDTFTTRVQAEVVDVKPNGTLVLQARKRIVTDEEDQLMVLNGVCRVQDITPDNTVLSTQLFDFDVRKSHSGAVRDATKRGWVPRLLDWANPF